MRVAVLVLANDKPLVLRHTMQHVQSLGWDFYVHLDAKRDLEAYAGALGAAGPSEPRWLAERVRIFWGGFSMVEATQALIAAAGPSYDRYLLISDDSVPALPPRSLATELGRPADRISARRVKEEEVFFNRYQKFYFLDSHATSLRGREIEHSHFDQQTLDELARLAALRIKGKVALDLRYGSQWWCLTQQSLLAITARLEEEERLHDSFRFSAVPDEMMFQSTYVRALGRAPNLPSPMAVDWSRDPRPYIYKGIAEFQNLLANRKPEVLFVRKIANDPALLAEINNCFDS